MWLCACYVYGRGSSAVPAVRAKINHSFTFHPIQRTSAAHQQTNRRVQRTCLFLYTLNLLAPKIRERPTAWIIKVVDRRAVVPSLLLSCSSFIAVKLPPPSSPPRYVQRSHLRVVTVELQPLRYRRATVAAMLVEMPQLHRIPSSIWSSEF